MNIYLDTEFDSFGGELISMAMVSSIGDEFYEVRAQMPLLLTDWVIHNVFPVLNKAGVEDDKFSRIFNEYIYNCLARTKDHHLTIIADYWEDLYHARRMIEELQYTKFDVSYKLCRHQDYIKSMIPHNALSDARALRISQMN